MRKKKNLGTGSAGSSKRREARAELAHARDSLADLYDFAPAGYLTLGKRVEAEVFAAAREWQRTFDGVADALFVLDAEQRVRRCNKAARRLFRKPMTAILGRYCWEIVHGATKPIPECPFRRTVGSRRREEMELAIGKRWYRVVVDPLLDRNGELRGAVHVVSDITERRRTEEAIRQLNVTLDQRVLERTAALRESETRFRTIFDAAGDGLFLNDLKTGRLHLANKACLDMLGYTPDEFSTLGLKDLHGEEDLPTIRAEIAKFRRGAVAPRAEVRFRRKDGATIETELHPTAVRLDGRDCVLVAIHDITARKEAERALARATRALRAVTACDEALLRVTREKDLFHEICRIIVELGGYPMAWVGLAEHDRNKTVRPIAHAGYADHLLTGPPITWAGSRRGNNPAATAIRTKRPALLRDLARNPAFAPWRRFVRKLGSDCALGLPLLADGRCFGALTVFGSGPTSFDGGEVKLLAQLSHDLSYGVVALRTRAARERLEQQLLEISERERRRIGQDLHDGLGQLIAAARLHCEATAHRLAMERLPAARDVTQVVRLLADAVDQTRRIARGLHPVHAGDEGLMAALGELADSVTAMSRVSCRFLCRQRVPVRDHGVATHLYRIAQEAVNNAVRHGRPRHIRIGLSSANGGVCLRIEDDGRGLPAPAKAGGGLGLSIMKYRASVIGATMAIGPRRGGGTVVTCEWRPGEKVTGSP